MLYGLTPENIRGNLGVTVPSIDLLPAFGIELFMTFILVFVICAAIDSDRGHRGYEIPLATGVCVFVCHMVAVSITRYITRILPLYRLKYKILTCT